jgi:hypothetical protein
MKFNNETLKAAVKQWLKDASSAEATYITEDLKK